MTELWFESGDAAALMSAPALLRRAGVEEPRYLGLLAAALTVRYQRAGRPQADPFRSPCRPDPADLDEAVDAARRALTAMPADDPDRPWVTNTLTVALSLRYERSGDLVELGEAFTLAGGDRPTYGHPPADSARAILLTWAAHTYTNGLPRRDLRCRDLSGSNLRNADLGGADLTGARLVNADLTGANLAGATLVSARLDGARLVGTVLSGADLTDAWLAGADLTDAHLTGATLDRAVLPSELVDTDALAAARIRLAVVSAAAELDVPVCKHPEARATVVAASGVLVATGHEDASIRIWDAATGMLLHEVGCMWDWSPTEGFTDEERDEDDPETLWVEVAALTFSPDGGGLAGVRGWGSPDAAYDAEILWWDLRNRWRPESRDVFYEGFDTTIDPEPRTLALVLAPDGRSLALGTGQPGGRGPEGTDNESQVWQAGRTWSLATGDAEWHGALAYSPNGRFIAAGYVDAEIGEHSVAVRHTDDGEPAGRWTTDGEAVLAVAFTGADRLRAVTSASLRWSAWEWRRDTGEAVALWHRDGMLTAAAYSADGLRVALATDGRVALCDAETGAELWSIAVDGVDLLHIAPDGRWLAAGPKHAVRVYDAGTGAVLPGAVRAVAFAPDGYWAILPDGSVHLHDFTGTPVRDLDPLRATKAGLGVSGMRLLHPDDLPDSHSRRQDELGA